MQLYAAIDLHSTNSVLVIQDAEDKVVRKKRLPNDLLEILEMLEPFRAEVTGVVVESTYNWYWLVDGLMDHGYRVHLANTAAVKQYEGLKYADDESDARWLATLLRLGVLPEGYIYPREDRAVRDLLRKRMHLVEQRTSNVLSVENLWARNTGGSISAAAIKRMACQATPVLAVDGDRALAIMSTLAVIACLDKQIKVLERTIGQRVGLRPAFRHLLTVDGIGKVLALTIMLETGEIGRFPTVGDFASYCRRVKSARISNNKRKGKGNAKNGNRYLAWAFIEAANFAIRYNDRVKRYYQRKSAKTKRIVALHAVAHKLARACYFIMRDGVPFDVKRAFG